MFHGYDILIAINMSFKYVAGSRKCHKCCNFLFTDK